MIIIVDFSVPVIVVLILYGVLQVFFGWGLQGPVGFWLGVIALIIGIISVVNSLGGIK